MPKASIVFSWFFLFTVLFAPNYATAFEWKKGDNIDVKSDETIHDDLYVTARGLVIDGTIDGDLVAFAQKVVINGSVNGSVIAAGESVEVNGTVTGNIRTAGAIISFGEKARVGGDVLGASAGLSVKKGAHLGRDLVFAGAGSLVEGSIKRNLRFAGAGLEIKGHVGGDVIAKVAEAKGNELTQAMSFSSSDIKVPQVKTGLTIDPGATILGKLDYTQSKDLSFPAGSVKGDVSRTDHTWRFEGRSEKKSSWIFGFLRHLITMLLVGLLLLLLFSRPISHATQKLEHNLLHSLLWGIVAAGLFLVSIIVTGVASILLAALLGIISFGSLALVAFFAGLLIELTLIFIFIVFIKFIATIIVGITLGKWMLAKMNSAYVDHRFVPMLVGVPTLVIVAKLLSLLPFVGGLISLAIVLFAFGSVWLAIRDRKSPNEEVNS